MKYLLAGLAYNIRLESSGEDLVNNAITVMRICSWKRAGFFTVAVHHVQRSNEEFVCILLFVACQVSGVCPDEV
jgi:hypothetical protein